MQTWEAAANEYVFSFFSSGGRSTRRTKEKKELLEKCPNPFFLHAHTMYSSTLFFAERSLAGIFFSCPVYAALVFALQRGEEGSQEQTSHARLPI